MSRLADFIRGCMPMRGGAFALAVLVVLCLVPAVCAGLGIAAGSGLQDNSSRLKVAVASNDEGYESSIMSVSVNLGDRIISALHGNEDYDWVFVSADEALWGVEDGDYLAAIIIPEDFSKTLMGAFNTLGQHAEADYYVNEKRMPVASVFADDAEGRSRALSGIADAFTQCAAEVSTSLASDVADASDGGKTQSVAEQLSSRLEIVANTLDGAAEQVDLFSGLMSASSSLTSAISSTLNGSGTAGGSSGGAVQNAAAALSQAASALRSAQAAAQQAGGNASNLANAELAAFTADASALASSAEGIASSAAGMASSLDDAVGTLNGSTGSMASQLTSTNDLLQGASGRLRESAQTVRQLRTDIVDALTAGDVVRLSELIGGNSTAAAQWLAAPVQVKGEAVYSVDSYASATAPFCTALALWAGALLVVLVLRAQGRGSVRMAGVVEDAQGGEDADLHAEAEESAVAREAVESESASAEAVAAADGMAESLETRIGTPSVLRAYAADFAPCAVLALVQGFVTWLVEMLFLGVSCAQPLLFLLACLVASLAFVALTFALVAFLGRLGQVLCVALLVLQVLGGSGYPAQMMGGAFGILDAILPFSHARSALMECVAGLHQANLLLAIAVLCAYLLVALVLGFALREPCARLRDGFRADLVL